MAQTIGPLVKRSSSLGTVAYAAMAIGLIASAAMVGLVLGLLGASAQLGRVPLQFRLLALSLFSAAWIAHELQLLRLPIIQRRAQVPSEWRAARPILGSGLYGIVLGTGVATYVAHSGIYVVIISSLLVASPVPALAIYGAYGLGRAVSIGLESLAQLRNPRWYLRMAALEGWLSRVQIAGLAFGVVLFPLHTFLL